MKGFNQLKRVFEKRQILDTLVRRDLRIRYARSWLGYVWTLIDPLAMALVYYMVFAVIFNRPEAMGMPFIVYMLGGLLPWNWFSNVINESSRSLYAERLLVRSTNLPREIWVIRVVIAKMIEHLLSLPILFAFALFYILQHKLALNWNIFAILPALVIEFVLLGGMGLVMAPVTALVDDFARLIRIALRVLFYFTPIVYEADLAKKWPILHDLLAFNPLTGISDLYRIGFVHATPNWKAIILSIVVSVFWLVFGLWVFRKLERAVLKEI